MTNATWTKDGKTFRYADREIPFSKIIEAENLDEERDFWTVIIREMGIAGAPELTDASDSDRYTFLSKNVDFSPKTTNVKLENLRNLDSLEIEFQKAARSYLGNSAWYTITLEYGFFRSVKMLLQMLNQIETIREVFGNEVQIEILNTYTDEPSSITLAFRS